MIRVAIETSTPLGTVAVADEDRLLAEIALGTQTRHAEMALPALAHALSVAGVDRSEIGEVVVGAGPGSFTGVRVAGATAKGLAAALDVPFRSFSSLLALAAGVASGRPVCALLDARREEVYAGCWRVTESGAEPLLEPTVGPVSEIVARLSGAGPVTAGGVNPLAGALDPVFAGDGAHRYHDALADAGAVVMPAPAHPRASTLLWLAAREPTVGLVSDVAAWEPSYVRASSAERGVAG